MMILSDETFGPVLFSNDRPLVLVFGTPGTDATKSALSAVRWFAIKAPFELRVAFLSPKAGSSIQGYYGFESGTSVIFFREAREVLRLTGKLTRERVLREIFRQMQTGKA